MRLLLLLSLALCLLLRLVHVRVLHDLLLNRQLDLLQEAHRLLLLLLLLLRLGCPCL